MIDDFSKETYIEKKNNYCLNCKDYNDGKSRNVFYKLPSILIIYPGRKNNGIKSNTKISFEEDLRIKEIANLESTIILYDLIGIIYHLKEDGQKGHNVAICKKQNSWYLFNDHKISQVEIDITNFSGEGILLLVYKKQI